MRISNLLAATFFAAFSTAVRAADIATAHEAAKPGETFAVVGDSLHDKETADAIGAACILYSGGSHAPERLRPVAPVADSLAAAVRLLRQI